MWDYERGTHEELESALLYKRIVEWTPNKLILDDGVVVTIECSEQDCCADAYGEFKDVKLDAVITGVNVGNQKDIPDDDTTVRQNTVTIFHNQNPIALAELEANAGNGGYYYSIGSVVVGDIHYPVVEA